MAAIPVDDRKQVTWDEANLDDEGLPTETEVPSGEWLSRVNYCNEHYPFRSSRWQTGTGQATPSWVRTQARTNASSRQAS